MKEQRTKTMRDLILTIIFTWCVMLLLSDLCVAKRPRLKPPIAELEAPTEASVNEVVTFDGSASRDMDSYGTGVENLNGIRYFAWDWDYDGDTFNWDYYERGGYAPDGNFDGITTHVFTEPGTYLVGLQVIDDDDPCGINETTHIIHITEPGIWYVDCSVIESGDGTSWETAFKTLLEALWKYGGGEPGPWSPPENLDIQAGDEIWVADGVYNLTETVAVYDDVRVYGGFRGKEVSYPGETERGQRDWKANLAIIDGGYDIYDIYAGCRCCYVYSDCTIDGFIIAHGRAVDGGGMFIAGSPEILNCGFVDNVVVSAVTARGGAIYTSSGSPLIKNCWFSRNDTIYIGRAGGFGGAMYNNGGSPVIMNCLVAGNKAQTNAGIYNWGSDAFVANCGFFGNTCTLVYTHDAGAAGVANRDRDTIGSNGTILNCTFSRNFTHDQWSTDVFCGSNSDSVVSNCVFWGSFTGQETYDFGGEAYASGSYVPSVISYCRVHAYKEENEELIWILGNFVETYAFTLKEDDPKFNGVIFNGTWTSNAAYNGILCQTELTDSYASWIPGQLEGKIIDLHTDDTTSGSGRSTEFKANTHYIVASNTETTVTVWGDATRAREFLWSYDPEWIIWYNIGQAGHDYWIYDFNLQSDSPCVDTGDPATSPSDVGPVDLAGNPRFVDGDGDRLAIVDMGAYEYTTPPVAHWKLDETEGLIADDSSVNNYDGTLCDDFPTDDSQWVTGQINGALEFDGTDDYVQITGYKGIIGDNPRTCSAWVKATPNSLNRVIMSWGRIAVDEGTGKKWIFRIGGEDYLSVGVYGAYVCGSTVIDNGWHHVAVTLQDQDGDSIIEVEDIRFFVDGQPDPIGDNKLNPETEITTESDGDVLLGSQNVDGQINTYFEGLMDDVRIYDRALSEAEIENLAGM